MQVPCVPEGVVHGTIAFGSHKVYEQKFSEAPAQ